MEAQQHMLSRIEQDFSSHPSCRASFSTIPDDQLGQAEMLVQQGEEALQQGDIQTAKDLFVDACDIFIELVS